MCSDQDNCAEIVIVELLVVVMMMSIEFTERLVGARCFARFISPNLHNHDKERVLLLSYSVDADTGTIQSYIAQGHTTRKW